MADNVAVAFVQLDSGTVYTVYDFPNSKRPASKPLPKGKGMTDEEIRDAHEVPAAPGARRLRSIALDGSSGHPAKDIEQEKVVIAVKTPLFQLGKVVATPGAIDALAEAQTSAWELLSRHVSGDFGEVDAEDWQANLAAIKDDSRILSAFTLKTGERLWAITEADRSSSCLLRPDEY